MQPGRHLLALAPAAGSNQPSDPLKMINVGAASLINLTSMQATRQPCRTRQVHAQDSTAHGGSRDTAAAGQELPVPSLSGTGSAACSQGSDAQAADGDSGEAACAGLHPTA